MPLPTPAARTHVHDRQTSFRGYRREDGLWDIEGQLIDTKRVPFVVNGARTWQPGEAVHGFSIRITIDDDATVQAIAVAMDDVPHRACPEAGAPMQRMVGCSMARGWRKAIEENLGGIQGCAHLRELLFNMATVAFQTMADRLQYTDDPNRPPPFLGKCMTWDFDGPTVERIYPLFFQRQHERGG